MNMYGFKISKKVLSVLLCVALLLSLAPISSLTAFAAEASAEAPDTPKNTSGPDLVYGSYKDVKVSVTVNEKDGYTYSYQWYYHSQKQDPIVGETSSTYTLPNDLARGKHSFFCVVTGTRNDNGLSAETEVEVGVYVSGAKSSIVKAPEAKTDLRFNGERQELVTAGTAEGGTVAYLVTTEVIDASEINNYIFSTSLPKAANVGTYYVWYKAKGDSNHKDTKAENYVTVDIGKAEIEKPAENNTEFIYNGEEQSYFETHIPDDSESNPVNPFEPVEPDTDNDITPDDNYEEENKENNENPDEQNGVFDSNTPSVKLPAPGAPTNPVVTFDPYAYDIIGGTQTEVGTYTVTVSLKDTNSSEWTDGTTDDLTYTFVIKAADYTVSFDTNGGEAVDPITVVPGEKYGTLPSSAITGLSGGNKNWYLVDENGNVTDINIKKLTTVEVERDHTLFIKRTVLAPTVSIALTVPGGISDGYQYYIPNASQRILTATVGNMNTEILDYTYQWYKDGVLIEGATSSVLTLDGNVSDSGTYKVEVTATLKDGSGIVVTANSATGSKEQKVKILHAANTLSYDANGGEGGPQSSYTGGDTLTVSSDAPTRENYDFTGWNTLSDGTGDAYKAADVYTFAEDNGNGGCVTTLYAQWSGKECTITFMSEDGVYKTLTYKYGETVEMPEAPAKDGYTVTWDTVIDTVTGDAIVNAVYTKFPITDTNPPQTEDNNNEDDNTKTEADTNAENNTQTGDSTPVDNTQADNIQADNADKSTSSPKTADYSNLWLCVAFIVVSGATITLIICDTKRKISKN